MDAAGCDRAALVASSDGGPMSILYSATYPQRTSALVLYGSFARMAWAPDYPSGLPSSSTNCGWSCFGIAGATGPRSRPWPRAWRRCRLAALVGPRRTLGVLTPPRCWGCSRRRGRSTPSTSSRRSRCPRWSSIGAGTGGSASGTAASSPSTSPALGSWSSPGDDHLFYAGDADAVLDEIEEFLTGARHGPESHRVLTTVLFTDIVESTQLAAQLGDQSLARPARTAPRRRPEPARPFRWRRGRHRRRRLLRHLRRARTRGSLRAGDRRRGRRAWASRSAPAFTPVNANSSAARSPAWPSTSALESRRPQDLAEVLVSSTVKDLLAGSGITFSDRG